MFTVDTCRYCFNDEVKEGEVKGCNLEQSMSWWPQGALGDETAVGGDSDRDVAQTDEGSGESAAIPSGKLT